MIHLAFSLYKARQIVDAGLSLVENAQNDEDKITEIDRTWHQLYGVKLVLDSCEAEMTQKASEKNDFAEYTEFIQICELLYQQMLEVEEMYEKALAQQKNK
jgi:hypothetical protein